MKYRPSNWGASVALALATLTAACAAPAGPQQASSVPAPAATPVYLNTSLDFETRAKDLVSRMTLEEKALQAGHTAPAIPRLGVPA